MTTLFTALLVIPAWVVPGAVMMIELLGALGLFLFGMKAMSDGIQKAAGERMRDILNHISSNRFLGVFTGFLITAIIQSSSATTVMAVSFVNASLLTLRQAIGIIMGANIGTTVTGWIVSVFGFKVSISTIALPIIGIGLPLFFAKKEKLRYWGEFLIGFGILFIGLSFMNKIIPTLKADDVTFLAPFIDLGFLSTLIFVFAGILITVVVHSSSASMAIVLTLVHNNILPFEAGAAMVLGGNIGTTIDAFLASIGANLNARRAAFFHFFFNLFGTIIIIFLFHPFLLLVDLLVPGHNPELALAAFHTLFNIFNTVLLIGFVPQLTLLIEKVIPARKHEGPVGRYRIEYVKSTIQDMPETHIIRVRKEISAMADISERMFNMFVEALHDPKMELGEVVLEAKKYEEYTDDMQEELSKYLVHCHSMEIGESTRVQLNNMFRIIQELESMSDSCLNLIMALDRKNTKKLPFHASAIEDMKPYTNLVKDFLFYIKNHLNEPIENDEELAKAYDLEDKIDAFRNKLKKEARREIQDGANVKGELLFLDVVRYVERLGDYCLNIAQAIRGVY
jgi:phosphate:Na+ symporter